MKILQQHPSPPFPIAGRPQRWTVQIKRKTWECVRVDYTEQGLEPFFVFLPVGAMKEPAFVAPMARLGAEAIWDEVTHMGGLIIRYMEPAGKRLELRLMGWRR